MSKYPFSQLIREILLQVQGLLPKPYKYTARKLNAVIEQNFLTEGGATLADFVVTPSRSRVYSFEGKSRNQLQGRRLQLRKEGI